MSNLFDLLQSDDDEPTQQVGKETTKPAAKEAAKPVAKAAPAKTDKPVVKSDNKGQSSPKLGGQPRNNTNSADKPRRAPRTEGQVAATGDDFAKSQNKRVPEKNFNRKLKTDQAGNIRGRQFDRKSGTGHPINGEVKKGGAGRANWDKTTVTPQEIEAVTETATEATTDAATAETPADPKENHLTLDEFLKQQQKESVQQDKPTLRKAGEGETNAQWDDFVALPRAVAKTSTKVATKENDKKPKKTIINLGEVAKQQGFKGNNKRAENNKKQEKKTPQASDFPALTKA